MEEPLRLEPLTIADRIAADMLSAYAVKTRAKRWARTVLRQSDLLYRAYAPIKGFWEERGAVRSRGFHEATAARVGLAVPQGEDLRNAVGERLAARGLRPVAKGKGALHIFATFPLSIWEAMLPTLLAGFGRVTVFEWRSLGYDDTASNWLQKRDAMNQHMLERFLTAHRTHPVDLVFGYLSGHNTAPEVLTTMSAQGAVIVNISMDDKGDFPGPMEGGRFRSPAALASAVDLSLTTSPESVVKYLVHGGLAMFCPLAGDPAIHRPFPGPFEFDVSFVGGRYCWRPLFIKRLRKIGINVATFGPGWPSGPLVGEDLVKLYSRSRINLSFSAVGNSRNVMYLKTRDFEIPMSGGLLLVQNNPELGVCYKIGEEIVVYKDERDCAQKIQWLLDHPEAAAMIREAGRRRALLDHTWERRFSDVFRLVGVLTT